MAKFPPPNPPFIKARHHGGSQRPKAIVLHGTVSSDNRGTARNIAHWWAGPSSPQSSAHYVVDPGEIIQCVGDHTVAFHCGFNTGSIGVEFCDEQQGPITRWNDADSNAILRRAARLVAQLCLAYNISVKRPSIADLKRKGPHGIYGHNDSRLAFGHTTHTDPRDFPWRKFMRMVRAERKAIIAETESVKVKVVAANIESRKRSWLLWSILKLRRPDVVVVEQAYNAREWLNSRKGYKNHQFRRNEALGGEANGIAVLVRDGVEVKNVKPLVMEQEWVGPKAGRRHDPRVYPALSLKKTGHFFRVIGIHLPTANEDDAQMESIRALRDYFRNHDKSPVFAPGDYNMRAAELRARVGNWARILTPGSKVDHALAARVENATASRVRTAKGAHGWAIYTFEI